MRSAILALAQETLKKDSLSCISYSNAGSGRNSRAQILWFVFAPDAHEPIAVARTVRNPAAAEMLAQSYANLLRLSAVDPELFVKPLAQTAQCTLEEYISGPPMRRADLDVLLDRYAQFAKRATTGIVHMETEICSLAELLLPPEERERFLTACAPLFPTTPLPGYIQHGDLTRDNIIFGPAGVRIIDCEHAHLTRVPGYDVYNLVSRIKAEDPRTRLIDYAHELGFSFEDRHLALFPAFHELLEARKKSGRIGEPVIYLETLLSLLP